MILFAAAETFELGSRLVVELVAQPAGGLRGQLGRAQVAEERLRGEVGDFAPCGVGCSDTIFTSALDGSSW